MRTKAGYAVVAASAVLLWAAVTCAQGGTEPGGSGTGTAKAGGKVTAQSTPTGNAVLSIVSGLPAPVGSPNALAGHPLVLLRESYADVIKKSGVSVPEGMSSYKYVATVCATKKPDCRKVMAAVQANAAASVRADTNGNGIIQGVPEGIYYLMVSAHYNKQALVWVQAVQLKPGANVVTLVERNATTLN